MQTGQGVEGAKKRSLSSGLTGESLNKKIKTHQNPSVEYAVSSTSSTNQNVSTESNNKIECPVCHVSVTSKYYSNHLKSKIHKNNVLSLDKEFTNVQLIESAFGKRIITYRILPDAIVSQALETPELFLHNTKSKVFKLLERSINEYFVVKVNFILNADFTQQTKQLNNTFDFQTFNYVFCRGDAMDDIFKLLSLEITNKITNFEKKDSGWSLVKIQYLDMNVNKFNPLRGSSYIDLPLDIKNKNAVINVKNNDHECFRWAVLSGLYKPTHNSNRYTSYLPHRNKLKFDNISFPIKINDIHKFEKLNDLSVNVFGLEFDSKSKLNKIIGPLHLTKSRKVIHLNLLYINHGTKGHYCYIKNLSRLVSKQITTSEHAIYICDGCLIYFSSNENLKKHQERDCFHVCTNLPSGSDTKRNWFNELAPCTQISFNNYDRKLRIPFVVYADFEAFLKPIKTCINDPSKSSTTNVQEHEMYSFGYYIKCSYDNSLSVYRTYTGENCAQTFMKLIKKDLEKICKKNTFAKDPLPLTEQDNENIVKSNTCYICQHSLNGEFIISHNHHTGAFEGVAHSSCSEKYRTPNFVPVFLHNLSNYDAHFIVHGLGFEEGNIDIIPQNKEKYISFSKQLLVNNRVMKLQFLDSLKFMSSSLDKLTKNLLPEQFQELKLNFPCEQDFKLLLRKGVYPYEHMKSSDSLKLASLPAYNDFYSSLNDENISKNDYQHACDVWNHFKCQHMGDYSNLYLKTDVLLLTDVFENFRNVCIETYGLDPAHYYTAPGLSWDAMLLSTKIKLELLTDIDKVTFIANNIRGGISQCSNRHAKANNIFMPEYDSSLPSSFLVYLDANNLYGWAMSQCLPTGNFEWVDTNTNFNVPDDAEHGYILEVDLEYPNNLHNNHSDLPFCPENVCLGDTKDKKLIPNLYNKTNYVIHYRNLKQCLRSGLRLLKIHRILKFKQKAWLKPYIDLNTHMRSLASSDFEKDFFKLMNNSVFGKTMENVNKRVNVKLLNHWKNRGKTQGVQSLIARPEFHSLSIFSENLVAVQLKKTKVLYNKPIYLGFCVLDLSKILMYDFHYDFMKTKYQDSLKLLYTDTDSLIYQIFTNNFYDDIIPDLESYFDTSDYPPNNVYGLPLVNKKRLGFFKDENNGKIFKEFIGLRSKMYAMDVQNNIIAKAKGVNKCVTKKLHFDDYRTCLFNKSNLLSDMLRFRSIKHVIYTQKINKISLSHSDTKRYLLENSTDTLAWGHFKITNIQS